MALPGTGIRCLRDTPGSQIFHLYGRAPSDWRFCFPWLERSRGRHRRAFDKWCDSSRIEKVIPPHCHHPGVPVQKRALTLSLVLLTTVSHIWGGATFGADAAAPMQPVSPRENPLLELPYTPSLDLTSMEKSADPCVDFYQYSCGGWMKNNPIPSDQASWSVYGKLQNENQRYLWGILSESAQPSPTRTANQQKIGDYFAACMDEPAIEKAGTAPLKEGLETMAVLASKADLARFIAQQHLTVASNNLAFGFGAAQDPKDSSRYIAFATAGGLGLPDRDYYTGTDPKSQDILKRYTAHVQKMFELLGDASKPAEANACLLYTSPSPRD